MAQCTRYHTHPLAAFVKARHEQFRTTFATLWKAGVNRAIEDKLRLKSPGSNHANRILILVTTLGFGGAEKQVVSLATELKTRGWEVAIASLVSATSLRSLAWASEYLLCARQLENQQIQVHSLDMRRGVPDFTAIFRLRSLIRNFRPDVVHCHMFHANILGRITRLFCRIPVLICTAHSIRENSQQGGPTWHKELLYRVTDKLADQTTIICRAGRDRYVRVGAVPPRKLRVIPNGIDTDFFTRSDERRRRARNALGLGPEFVWLAVGRLVVQKDYPTLFRALEVLRRKRFVVLIAGSGLLERELRQDCANRGLSQSVRFCGSSQNIIDLYDAADAFVMSSECEGLPLSLLEAASMGLPAVVTEVGGNPEVVIDNVTGYVVPPGAPSHLAAALQQVMEAPPERWKEMSRAARQHCHEHYRISAIVDQWADFYASYLEPAN
jgi:glycosyltransferase involved in cell wall biosynthesis